MNIGMVTALVPPIRPAPVAFDTLTTARLSRMVEAGQRLIGTARILAKTEDSLVGQVTGHAGALRPYAHYPDGDIVDQESGAQFFYHLHPIPALGHSEGRPGEEGYLGHFHCFAPAPASAEDAGHHSLGLRRGSGLAHLVAVAADRQNLPVRLFTTNRWVTGETWVAAAAATRLVDGFVVELARPSLSAAIWISSVMRLFQPQIASLLAARDAALDALAQERPHADPHEERDLEIPSAMEVSVEAQMAEIRAALALRGG